LFTSWVSTRRQKSCRSRNGPCALALAHDVVHRAVADVLHAVETEAHDRTVGREVAVGRVDVRRQHLDAHVARVGDVLGDLVAVAAFDREEGGGERDRVVRLEVRGLERDHPVRRGMGLVEAVVRELLEQVEDPVGLDLGHPARARTRLEDRPVAVHLGDLLLAHHAPQDVGLAEAVPGDRLRDLHDLLLVDGDAVGLGQDRRQDGRGRRHVRVGDLLQPVVAPDVRGDVLHGSGAVQRRHRDQVLDAARLELAQRVHHARRLELEHARGVAARQQLEGRRIVVREGVGVEVDAVRLFDDAHGGLDERERAEAEEVHLDEPELLDRAHVVLADDRSVAAAEHRCELGDRIARDDDAGGVHRGVARQPLELDRDVHVRLRAGVVELAHLRDLGERLLDGHRAPEHRRHQLRHLVGVGERRLHHPRRVLDRRARRERPEGGDVGDPVLAVGGARSRSPRCGEGPRSRCRSPASRRGPG
jgi:hypothetical protein